MNDNALKPAEHSADVMLALLATLLVEDAVKTLNAQTSHAEEDDSGN